MSHVSHGVHCIQTPYVQVLNVVSALRLARVALHYEPSRHYLLTVGQIAPVLAHFGSLVLCFVYFAAVVSMEMLAKEPIFKTQAQTCGYLGQCASQPHTAQPLQYLKGCKDRPPAFDCPTSALLSMFMMFTGLCPVSDPLFSALVFVLSSLASLAVKCNFLSALLLECFTLSPPLSESSHGQSAASRQAWCTLERRALLKQRRAASCLSLLLCLAALGCQCTGRQAHVVVPASCMWWTFYLYLMWSTFYLYLMCVLWCQATLIVVCAACGRDELARYSLRKRADDQQPRRLLEHTCHLLFFWMLRGAGHHSV